MTTPTPHGAMPELPAIDYALLAKHLGPETANLLCITRWYDGIDIEEPCAGTVRLLQAYALAAIQQAAGAVPEGVEALLYEHEDGRYAVNPNTAGDPKWHRLGPVAMPARLPVAWSRTRYIYDNDEREVGLDEPEVSWTIERPDGDGWLPLFDEPGAPVTASKGWKLVPVEPTDEMIGAMAICDASGQRNGEPTVGMAGAEEAYEAMLAASPSPLGREAGKEGSSDHLVPCAGGGVTQPLTEGDAK